MPIALGEKLKWSDDQVSTLIIIFKEEHPKFSNTNIKKNVLWNGIKEKFNSLHGTNYTYVQVRDKVMNLRKAYIKKKEKMKSTGEKNIPFKWFDELDEIYGNDPAISPRNTFNSINATPSQNGN